MRHALVRAAAGAWLAAASMSAVAELDLEAFDGEAMRAMDDAFKDLEPVLGAANASAAKANIATLNEGYAWTLEYFTAQEKEAKDGIALLHEGRGLLEQIAAAVDAKDFDRATARTRDLRANCKACHDQYKPKKQ